MNTSENGKKDGNCGAFRCVSHGGSFASSERVGLLQQDDRPHPSHRLRPQGLSCTVIESKNPESFVFRDFLFLVRFSQKRWSGTKTPPWYDNGQKKPKVFRTIFRVGLGTERGICMLSMKGLVQEFIFDCQVRNLAPRTIHNFEKHPSYFLHYLIIMSLFPVGE